MKIEDIEEEYNKKLEVRDNLSIVKEELNELEEDEKVKEYKYLKEYYDANKELDNLDDDSVLFSIIDDVELELDKLPEVYFCLGKNIKARMNKKGEYYILPQEDTTKGLFKKTTYVGIYKNFKNPHIIKIIPVGDIREFEEKYPILRAGGYSGEDEYIKLRRAVIRDELNNINSKKMEKKD